MRNPALTASACALAFALSWFAATAGAASHDRPSRPPVKGCKWEKFADPKLGLNAWVQRCDFGFRKIDFLTRGKSLAIRYSDAGDPDPVIDVIDVRKDELPLAAMKRHFVAHTAAAIARRCVLAPYRGVAPRPGVLRYAFVPDATYRQELRRKAKPDEVGDPPCGEWGDAPDGIQYYEAPANQGAHKILFVRVGQDEPLFDEKTLRVTMPAAGRSAK
ncbi:MAG TPA: hypothetical protein VGO84_10785 [Burkholderiales bacterium]|jgi:hypothetical protein|nr:hypothetical protein [Burkholderiales bacterium]